MRVLFAMAHLFFFIPPAQAIAPPQATKSPEKTAVFPTSAGTLRLTYSNAFEEVTPSPRGDNALVILRTIGATYPTLNILEAPGTVDPSHDLNSRIGEDILSEYRKVGILDAELQNAEYILLKERRIPLLSIAYNWNEASVISYVALINLGASHLICTYITTSPAQEVGRTDLLWHLSQLELPHEMLAHSSQNDMPSHTSLLFVAGVAAALPALFFWVRNRRVKTR